MADAIGYMLSPHPRLDPIAEDVGTSMTQAFVSRAQGPRTRPGLYGESAFQAFIEAVKDVGTSMVLAPTSMEKYYTPSSLRKS
jgi:hypothetical protein